MCGGERNWQLPTIGVHHRGLLREAYAQRPSQVVLEVWPAEQRPKALFFEKADEPSLLVTLEMGHGNDGSIGLPDGGYSFVQVSASTVHFRR